MLGSARASSTREYQLLSTTNITSTGSQNYTIPAGAVYIEVEMWGGGGGGGDWGQYGGGRGSTTTSGAGGGGGAYFKKKIQNIYLIENYTIQFTVGAGGAVGDGNGQTEGKGSDGGNSQVVGMSNSGGVQVIGFSNYLANGGEGGEGGYNGTSSGGAGGTSQNGKKILAATRVAIHIAPRR